VTPEPFLKSLTGYVIRTSDDVTYGIHKYRNRKKWALVRSNPGTGTVVAYFQTKDDAVDFAREFGMGEPTDDNLLIYG